MLNKIKKAYLVFIQVKNTTRAIEVEALNALDAERAVLTVYSNATSVVVV